MDLNAYLEAARSRLERVDPADVDALMADGAYVIDIRPEADRQRFGAMPGAQIIERNVLLWRLSPSSDTRIADIGPDDHVIVFCNDGFASSIAATQLQDVGVPGATDLAGGFNAWKRLRDVP